VNIEDMIKGGFFTASPFTDRRIVRFPAHPSNYYPNRICTPISLFIHEPQEPADERESTPVYFATPNVGGTTRWYGDDDGDLYHMVPFPAAAIANGLDGRPEPKFLDGGPEFNGRSLNICSDNIEVEGYTGTIHQTYSNTQHAGLVDWLVLGFVLWNIPRNPKRVLPHGYVSQHRTDGIWIVEKSGAPEEAVNRVLTMEKDILELKALAWNGAKKDNELGALILGHALRLNGLEEHTVHPPKK